MFCKFLENKLLLNFFGCEKLWFVVLENAHQQVSNFDRSLFVAYRIGLSYHSIAARVGWDPMTVCRLWSRWFKEGYTKRHAGSQQLTVTNCREDRHLIYTTLMDHTDASRALSQKMWWLTARKIRRCLYQQGLSALRPWLGLKKPLKLHHTQ